MNHFIPRTLAYLALCLLLVLAIALNVLRFFLSNAEEYKDELQNKLREVSELPIEIGGLHAYLRGFNAEFVLTDIQLPIMNGNKADVIEAEQLQLRVNLLQLIFTQQLLPSSWLTLVGVELSLVRKIDGSLSIVGIPSDDSSEPEWLFKGGGYALLNSQISWLDEQKKSPSMIFEKVDLLLKNERNPANHEIHLLTQLPEQYGHSLRVSMLIQGYDFTAENIDGQVYIEAEDILLSELLKTQMPLGLNIQSGQASFKKWIELKKSKLSTMMGMVQAKNIVLEKPGKKKSLHVKALTTEFNVHNNENVWALSVADFALETDQQKWPVASFSLAVDDEFNQVAASVLQLDLAELTQAIQFFSATDASQNKWVEQLGLKGMLKDLSFYIDNEHSHYAMNGSFNNIFTRAFEGFPEINNLTGEIKGSDEKGVFTFNTDKGELFFPKIFRKPLLIEQLIGQLNWLQTSDKWQISTERLVLNTSDIETVTQVKVDIPKADAPVVMDLQASFANMQDISLVSNYFPASIMDKDVLDWLDHAFVSGKITQGDLLVYGEMDQFPFVNNQGVFEVLYHMDDIELQYNSDWPNLKKVNAEVLFLKNSVQIDMTHAQVDGLTIKHAILKIPSFATSNHLFVRGDIEGKIFDGLKFLQKTPLAATANSVLKAITPSGMTRIDLDLNIPLADTAEVVANVGLPLSNAAIKVNAIDLYITDVNGKLRITEQGLFSKNVKARALGFPLLMNAFSDDLKTLIKIEGKTDILHLQKQFAFFDSWILNDRLKGSTGYQLNLDLPANDSESARLNITSDLLGIAVDFPESLYKTAEQESLLEVSMALNEEALLALSLEYQEDLKVAMKIDKETDQVHAADIFYGNKQNKSFLYQSGELPDTELALLDQGIKIQIQRDQFDLTEWQAFLKQEDEDTEENKSEASVNEINLVTQQLLWKDKSYDAFELAMHQINGQWQGNLSSIVAKGAFILPIDANEKEPVRLDMAYMNVSELMQIDFKGQQIELENVPLIDVVSEQLWWKDVDLGRLEIATERLGDGIQFKQVEIVSNRHKIELTMNWKNNDQGVNTDMSGSIQTDDFGAFLSQFNFSNDFKESQGDMSFYAIWPGSPYQFSLGAISAELDIELKEGRLASIEPGFGRVLGLIAINQWLKRLTLDFGDLYKQGLSFDNIEGQFKIEQGKAVTSNLLVDAVPARILIIGEADLLAQTLDHSMGVVPKSSDALPIAGTIVSGLAGIITQAFTSDYKEGFFFGSQYKVEGSWDDIKVTPVHEQDGVLKKTWTGLTDFSWMSAN